MKQRIRVIAILLAIISLFSTLSVTAASVEPKASLYIDDYFVPISALSSGDVRVTFHVWGTGIMTKLGAKTIELEVSTNNSTWVSLTTVQSDESLHPDMLGEDVAYYTSYVDFDGMPGMYYRAIVTVYSANNSGSDSRTVTTSSVYINP